MAESGAHSIKTHAESALMAAKDETVYLGEKASEGAKEVLKGTQEKLG